MAGKSPRRGNTSNSLRFRPQLEILENRDVPAISLGRSTLDLPGLTPGHITAAFARPNAQQLQTISPSIRAVGVRVYHPVRLVPSGARSTGFITLLSNKTLLGPTTIVLHPPKGVTLLNPTGKTGKGNLYIQVPRGLTANVPLRIRVVYSNTASLYRATFYRGYPVDVHTGPFDPRTEGTPTPEIAVKGGSGPTSIADGSKATSITDGTDFGSVGITAGVVDRIFTVANTGSASLGVKGVTITGTGAAQFSVTGTPAGSVSKGGTTTFKVSFDPSATGTSTATIHVANSDSDEADYDFLVTGTGTAPEIDIEGGSGPTSITDGSTATSTTDGTDFGSVGITTGVVERTFTIANTGSASLDVAGVTITGTGAAQFSVTGTPAGSVSSGGTTTFKVSFDPSATGTFTATIHVANSDSDEADYDFVVTGTGTDIVNYRAVIQVKSGGTSLGYVAPDPNYWTPLLTSDINGALIVDFSLSNGDTSATGLNLTQENDSRGQYFGPVVGRDSTSSNIAPGSFNYLYLDPITNPTPPNSPPQSGPSYFSTSSGLDKQNETAVWTVDVSAGTLAPVWTNTDGSNPTTQTFVQSNHLYAGGDPAAFQGRFPATVTTVTLTLILL